MPIHTKKFLFFSKLNFAISNQVHNYGFKNKKHVNSGKKIAKDAALQQYYRD